MKIEKMYVEEPGQWKETTEKEFIRHTEEAGYWKPGTATQTLIDAGEIRTPFAFYRIKAEGK